MGAVVNEGFPGRSDSNFLRSASNTQGVTGHTDSGNRAQSGPWPSPAHSFFLSFPLLFSLCRLPLTYRGVFKVVICNVSEVVPAASSGLNSSRDSSRAGEAGWGRRAG